MKNLIIVWMATVLYSTVAVGANIEIESMGRTFEEAKRAGFKQAIERATGVLTISEQEISGYKMTRDYIGSYSSGWVENYEITDAFQDANGTWIVQMTVEVRDSKIKSHSERRNTTNSVVIDGVKQSDRLTSQLEQRRQADELLSVVMRSYPEHAYVINQGNTEFAINNRRQPYVDINYVITMSHPWTVALKEALDAVSVSKEECTTLSMVIADGIARSSSHSVKKIMNQVCGDEPDAVVYVKNPKDWFPRAHSYYLPDVKILELINQNLHPHQGQQQMGLRIDLFNGAGTVIDSYCAPVYNKLFIHYIVPKGAYNYNQQQQLSRPNIMGQNEMKGQVRIPVNTQQLDDLVRIKLSIQHTC